MRGALRGLRRRRACCSRAPPDPRYVAELRSSTPTARRPSCPATARARRSSTCAAAAGPTGQLRDPDRWPGTIRPTITGPDTCSVDMGTAALQLEGLSRPADRTARGQVRSAWRALVLPARLDRQSPVRDPRRHARMSSRARSPVDRARDRRQRRCFPTARTSPGTPSCRSARPNPRTHLRAGRGGDALLRHRRAPAPPSPICSRRAGAPGAVEVILDGGELAVRWARTETILRDQPDEGR